jgi:hypothetical protein
MLEDSVMARFLARGVPIIHMTGIARLAREHGLPIEPSTLPPVGSGTVFVKPEYNRWLTAAGLALIRGAMLTFIRWDVGSRILAGSPRAAEERQPQQMI